jgi:hypothetical protein
MTRSPTSIATRCTSPPSTGHRHWPSASAITLRTGNLSGTVATRCTVHS